uniref:SAM domain-containing protein n=1 Tax=Elaeophora elaphi TaxID=1147741 RepID=A0A0R3RVF5_9BILA
MGERTATVCRSSLMSNFTAAVAAAAQPRHERYAAHIPVTRVNGSGRQSTTSIDSCNSGTLENTTTTQQVDQMIDQARYRHHQHRNKFKEAIDYLDQIFEDLKKEGEQVDSAQRSRGLPAASARKATLNTDLTNVASSSPVKPLQRNGNSKRMMANIVDLEEMDSRQSASTNRHSLYASKPRITEKHCLREKAASFEQSSNDMTTSETIVLPPQNRKLKGEKLDFTRRWLTGDIKSWIAIQPKPDLILGGVEEEPDIDERSLGSCSAEVAAINSVVRKKKKALDVPDLIQNVASNKYVRQSNAHQTDPSTRKSSGGGSGSGQYVQQQTDPIKPRPVKAQPTFNFPTGSTGNLDNFNNFSQSFHDSNVWTSNCDLNSNQTSLQRTPSHSRISEPRNHDFATVSWRSSSHDPRHNTLSSVRSEEGQLSIRRTGAFTPVQPPSMVTVRGSVASLPDSSNLRPQPLHNADPIVAIDALVAELELNTDQTSVANKRRSFPTGNEFFVRHVDNNDKLVSSQLLEQKNIQPSAKTKPEHNIDRKRQQPQKLKDSFNEMANMLQSVISDVATSNEMSKGRKYVQMGVKNNSMLSPFETINQEKLNPSKVEAMQSIFENKQYAPVWRRSSISNGNNDNVQSAANIKDDDNYYEINDFALLRKETIPAPTKSLGKQSSPAIRSTFQSKRRLPSAAPAATATVPSRPEFVPAFSVTHPPPRPPGSTNSSQTGGYYSSGSSLGAQSSYTSPNNNSSIPHSPGNRGAAVSTKQLISSQTASFDEEDDGFYDNIQMDEKHFSRGSEFDSISTCSHRILSTINSKPSGPVKASNRIGQFLRKISASKPPISAASLVSLNKVANEIMPRPVPLMKSSSLSHCQGKKHIVQNMNTTASSAVVDKRGGLGQRLKNSIFGSKKRLN